MIVAGAMNQSETGCLNKSPARQIAPVLIRIPFGEALCIKNCYDPAEGTTAEIHRVTHQNFATVRIPHAHHCLAQAIENSSNSTL